MNEPLSLLYLKGISVKKHDSVNNKRTRINHTNPTLAVLSSTLFYFEIFRIKWRVPGNDKLYFARLTERQTMINRHTLMSKIINNDSNQLNCNEIKKIAHNASMDSQVDINNVPAIKDSINNLLKLLPAECASRSIIETIFGMTLNKENIIIKKSTTKFRKNPFLFVILFSIFN